MRFEKPVLCETLALRNPDKPTETLMTRIFCTTGVRTNSSVLKEILAVDKRFYGVFLPLLLVMAHFVSSTAYALSNTAEWPVTDFENSSIDHTEILSGGPPKDGIPSIDKPDFVALSEASEWLKDNEPVISLEVNGDARAYPLQILMWHEIVNDVIGGQAVSVTFCPLCNASIVFDRTVDDEVLDFGTTGRLRRSDMVMYDRQTESWWQQFTGTGIIGKMNGVVLRQLPSNIVSFADFKKQFDDGRVLSRDTGVQRRYGENPYVGYDDINARPFLFRGEISDRLPAMERVLALRGDNSTLLFALSSLVKQPLINTRFDEQPVAVFGFSTMASALDKRDISASRDIPSAAIYLAEVDGKSLTFELADGFAVDRETGTSWNIFGVAQEGELAGKKLRQLDGGVHFAFAWLAFDPDARVFSP